MATCRSGSEMPLFNDLFLAASQPSPVIHEGAVKRTKYIENGKKSKKNWTECYMILTPTALIFFKDHKTYQAFWQSKPDTPPSPSGPRPELVLPLHYARVLPSRPLHTRRHSKSLWLTVDHDEYLIQDESVKGCDKWYLEIHKVICKLYPLLMNMEHPALHTQSSNSDLESPNSTPPAARHANKNKQKAGGNSNEDLSDSTENSIPKSHIKRRLREFFGRRPAIEMVYSRPSSLPFPTIWRRFTARSTPFRIQDLTEEMFPAALELLARHFTADEPPCKYIEINKHPTALAELKKLWSTTMQDRLSLVCVTDDAAETMVSVNVLTVAKKEDKDEPFHTEDPVWAALFGAVDLVSKGADIFEQFAVDRYLTAYGLVVDPAWRGLNIGRHMLEARIPLCKALGVKVTATVFTAGASQAVAKKAGFVDLYEISYEELAAKGFVFPGVEKDTKSSKLMALLIE